MIPGLISHVNRRAGKQNVVYSQYTTFLGGSKVGTPVMSRFKPQLKGAETL